MRIAILDDYQNVALDYADWDRLGAEIEVFTDNVTDTEQLSGRLAGFDVVVAMRERTPFPAELFDRLPDLRLLVSTGPRNAVIDLAAARRHGVTVCATGYSGEATTEHTWALILAAARDLPAEEARMRAGGWQGSVGTTLYGKTLGLLGLGRLGTAVAGIGQAFGMRTIAYSERLTTERAAEQGVTVVSKEALFRTADVLSVHLVLSRRTRGLVGADELALMKRSAILVNTSRGPIVDEQALIEVVQRGGIHKAAIDVYDIEPLPANHPLRSCPNTVLTPHIGFVSDDTYRVFFADAVADIEAFAAGEPIRVLT